MKMRTTVGAVMVAALALVAGACGGDDGADGTTTTAKSSKDTTTTSAKPLTDKEYAEQVEPYGDQIEAAGTDFCSVFEVVSTASGPSAMPATEAQVRVFIDTQVKFLRAIAATEPVNAENAAVLNKSADDIVAAAEAAGYSKDFPSGDEFSKIANSKELTGALNPYTTRAASECQPPDTAAGGKDSGSTETTVAPKG